MITVVGLCTLSGFTLRAGVPGASSCREPPEGLAPFRTVRSSRLVRKRLFLQPFSSRDSARSSLGLGGGGFGVKGLAWACGSSLLTCSGVSRGSSGLLSGPRRSPAAGDPRQGTGSSSLFGSSPLSMLSSGRRHPWAVGCWGAVSECPKLTNLDGIVRGPALRAGGSLADPGNGSSGGCCRRPGSGPCAWLWLGGRGAEAWQQLPLGPGVVRLGQDQLLHGWEPRRSGVPRKYLREHPAVSLHHQGSDAT